MDKIKFKLAAKMEGLRTQMEPNEYAQIVIWERFRDKINEIIDILNDKNCSPITCPFNTLIDQLAKRTKKLEFYDKQHRREHSKDARDKV